MPDGPTAGDHREQRRPGAEQRPHRAGARAAGEAARASTAPPTGSVAAPENGDDAVVAHQEARRGEAVDRQERGHRRERRAHSTARPSPRRAPAIVSASAAAAARPALTRWRGSARRRRSGPRCPPKKWMTPPGSTAHAPRSAEEGHGADRASSAFIAPCVSARAGARRALHVHDMSPVAIDFEAEGLLDGVEDEEAREARLELLRTLERGRVRARRAPRRPQEGRLVLLPVERVLRGDGPRYTREELAEETGLDQDFLRRAWRAMGMPEPERAERGVRRGGAGAAELEALPRRRASPRRRCSS